MNTPGDEKLLEPIFLDGGFRFDQHSDELERIKSALSSGMSVSLSVTDLPDDKGGSKIETLACFLAVEGERYRCELRETHGECFRETSGDHIAQLGTLSPGTDRIMSALSLGDDVYLVPEGTPASGEHGVYAFCRLEF